MIGRLTGTIAEVLDSQLVIDVGGVGYEVIVAPTTALALSELGVQRTLWIRQIIREDSANLYGFSDAWERALFDLLITAKGCGPKVALSLLSQFGPQQLVGLIAAEDNVALTKASGVGTRMAERIVVELKEKANLLVLQMKVTVPASKTPASTAQDTGDELLDALVSLGYRQSEARLATEGLVGPLEDRLKEALLRLRK